MKKQFTINFEIYKGKDGQTWFVESYQEVKSGKRFYRYGHGETDNWTTVKEGLTQRPDLKKLGII